MFTSNLVQDFTRAQAQERFEREAREEAFFRASLAAIVGLVVVLMVWP
jgi:hypothetical protein